MRSKPNTKLIPNSNKDTYLGYLRKNFEPNFLCSSLCSQSRDNLPYEDWQMSLSFWYLMWEKKLRASEIYHRHSGFSTQLRYRFIRRPQSKETSPHDISSEVPKSSVTKLKGPQNAPFSFSTATNSTQHRLLWTTTCYFCVPCFHYGTLLFPAAQFPYTLEYLTQLPTVYIWKNQMSCVQSVQLSTLIFCRLRSYICTEAGSLNSKGHTTHSIIKGKNNIKSALGILQFPFQLSDYIQYRIEKKIVRPDLHVWAW